MKGEEAMDEETRAELGRLILMGEIDHGPEDSLGYDGPRLIMGSR